MASSLTEPRFGHFGAYENPYAAFLPMDASMAASPQRLHYASPSMGKGACGGVGAGALDFLTYADHLLNSFSTSSAKGSASSMMASAQSATTEAILHAGRGRQQDLSSMEEHFLTSEELLDTAFASADFLSLQPQAPLYSGCGGYPPQHQQGVTQSDLTSPVLDDQAAWFAQFAPPGAGHHGPKVHGGLQRGHHMGSSQEWRLCVKAPTLGTFYLFTASHKTIAEIIPDIESKVWELYHTPIHVHLVQNDHGIDLPFSCLVSSVLEDRALVCAQYMRINNEASTAAGVVDGHAHHQATLASSEVAASPVRTYSPSSGHHSPHSPPSSSASDRSAPHSPFLQSYTSPHQSSGSLPATPCEQGDGQPEKEVRFREPPPSKVLQNKEFSFTVSMKSLKYGFVAFSSHNLLESFVRQTTNNASCPESGVASISVPTNNNPWGAPVPMPLDDADDDSTDCFKSFEIPIEVVVEEEGGGMLHPRDFRIRCSVLDKQEGLYVFFVKLKKNSHYGRTRFIIKIRRKQPTKEERSMEYLETALMHNYNNADTQMKPGHDLGGGARADLLVSHPIVVISKERKTKRKRGKPDNH